MFLLLLDRNKLLGIMTKKIKQKNHFLNHFFAILEHFFAILEHFFVSFLDIKRHFIVSIWGK